MNEKINDKTMYKVMMSIKNSHISEKQIEIYKQYMDKHLDLLSKALKDNHLEEIEFQKQQLEKVRLRLMELEAFPFKSK